MKTNFPVVNILGIPVTSLTVPELQAYIFARIEEQRKTCILHANVHGVNLACKLPWLKAFYQEADLVFCDGAGIILGAKLLGFSIPVRITYADWLWQLGAFAEEKGLSLYFLGAQPGVAMRAASQLQRQHPELRVVGTRDGYFEKTPGSSENRQAIAAINAVKPDILIVGFGMPIQERWLKENWEQLDVRVALTGGAVFDYISGDLRRAPRWMNEHGLEWLGRLVIEPGRLWRRYILGNPTFLWRVLLQRLGLRK